jgi:hypothetical protein
MSEEGKPSSGQGKPPRRVGCVSRAVYILIVAVLILSFVGGTFYLLWYQPVSADLAEANAQLEELRPLLAENEVLAAEVQRSGTRLLILSALVDVNAARVSLALGDPEAAADRLDSIRQSLAAVESRLRAGEAGGGGHGASPRVGRRSYRRGFVRRAKRSGGPGERPVGLGGTAGRRLTVKRPEDAPPGRAAGRRFHSRKAGRTRSRVRIRRVA